VRGIRELTEQAGVSPSALDQVFHGTTIATNIVIEHNGARVGMLTTEGYRDILHIARHRSRSTSRTIRICRGSATRSCDARPADGARAHSSATARCSCRSTRSAPVEVRKLKETVSSDRRVLSLLVPEPDTSVA